MARVQGTGMAVDGTKIQRNENSQVESYHGGKPEVAAAPDHKGLSTVVGGGKAPKLPKLTAKNNELFTCIMKQCGLKEESQGPLLSALSLVSERNRADACARISGILADVPEPTKKG